MPYTKHAHNNNETCLYCKCQESFEIVDTAYRTAFSEFHCMLFRVMQCKTCEAVFHFEKTEPIVIEKLADNTSDPFCFTKEEKYKWSVFLLS